MRAAIAGTGGASWVATRSANRPPRAISSAKLPRSTTLPWSNTRISSASHTVDRRCAMMNVARAAIRVFSARPTRALVQAFTRLAAEARIFGDIAQQSIRQQFPVLNWWALVGVLTRAASTLAMITIVAIGTWLHVRGQAGIGEIVSFMGFATLLIGRMESAVSFAASLFYQAADDCWARRAQCRNARMLVTCGRRVARWRSIPCRSRCRRGAARLTAEGSADPDPRRSDQRAGMATIQISKGQGTACPHAEQGSRPKPIA